MRPSTRFINSWEYEWRANLENAPKPYESTRDCFYRFSVLFTWIHVHTHSIVQIFVYLTRRTKHEKNSNLEKALQFCILCSLCSSENNFFSGFYFFFGFEKRGETKEDSIAKMSKHAYFVYLLRFAFDICDYVWHSYTKYPWINSLVGWPVLVDDDHPLAICMKR